MSPARKTCSLLAAVVFTALPSSALAATVLVDPQSSTLVYEAGVGEANDLQISEPSVAVTIIDAGAVISAGAGCSQVTDHQVTCSGAAEAVFDLGDLNDTAAVAVQDSVGFQLYGGDGNDSLTLCPQCSGFLSGGRGGDALTGGDLGALLLGGADADTITGGAWRDDIRGAGGSDAITAGRGRDFLYPGSGNDQIDGGPGVDEIFLYTAHAGVVVDLRVGAITGYGTKTLTATENVVGTNYPDKLYGDRGPNALSGLGGADLLVGRRGADFLLGCSCRGNDRLYGGPGPDRLLDGPGDDLLIGGAGNDLLEGGRGEDRMHGWHGDDRFLARDGFRDIVRGGEGDDVARVDFGLDVTRSISAFF